MPGWTDVAGLDDFEGAAYERVLTAARTATGDIEVSVYVLSAGDPSGT